MSGTKTVENTPSITPEPWPPAPQTYWLADYGLSSTVSVPAAYLGVAKDSDGNIICVGHITLSGSTRIAVITKYDKNGNILWNKRLNKVFSTTCVSVAIDSSDNIYVVGNYNGGANGTFFVKFNKDGAVLLFLTQNSYAELCYKVCLDPSGGVYILFLGQIVKLDSSGVFSWATVPSTFFTRDMWVDNNYVYVALDKTNADFLVLSASTGTKVSASYFSSNYGTSTTIAYGGAQYFYMLCDGPNIIVKFDFSNQSIVWKKQLSAFGLDYTSLNYFNNKLYLSGQALFTSSGQYTSLEGIFCCEIEPNTSTLNWSNSINFIPPPINSRIFTEVYKATPFVDSNSFSIAGYVTRAIGRPGRTLVTEFPITGAVPGGTQTTIGNYYYTNNFTLGANQCNALTNYAPSLTVTDATSSVSISTGPVTFTSESSGLWTNYSGLSTVYSFPV